MRNGRRRRRSRQRLPLRTPTSLRRIPVGPDVGYSGRAPKSGDFGLLPLPPPPDARGRLAASAGESGPRSRPAPCGRLRIARPAATLRPEPGSVHRGSANVKESVGCAHPQATPRPLLSFWREAGSKFDAFLNPCTQLFFSFVSAGFDKQPAFHRSSGQVKRFGVWFFEKHTVSSRIDAYNQILVIDSTSHVAVQKEAHTTEHFLFNNWDAIKLRTNSFGEFFVVCHTYLLFYLALQVIISQRGLLGNSCQFPTFFAESIHLCFIQQLFCFKIPDDLFIFPLQRLSYIHHRCSHRFRRFWFGRRNKHAVHTFLLSQTTNYLLPTSELPCSKLTISRVAEARHDVGALVETLIDRGDVDINVRVGGLHRLDSLRRGDQTYEL